MTKQILWMSLILIAMFATASVSTRAQTALGVRGDVPFDFVVGDKTIRAGRITAHGISNASAGPILIQNQSQSDLALRVGRRILGAETTNQCKLVFNKYGNRYFLAQIWIPGYQPWKITKSKAERSLEREMRLGKNFKPSQVIVAATTE